MNTKALLTVLSSHGCMAVTDRKHGLSSLLIRGVVGGVPTVAVGGEQAVNEQIYGFLDAVYWHHLNEGGGAARFIIGSGNRTVEVLRAVATLEHALGNRLRVDVELDLNRHALARPSFPVKIDWLRQLRARTTMSLPPLASRLSAEVNRESFRWYRSVSLGPWSGRLDGLQVCEAPATGIEPIHLQVGSLGTSGAESAARRRFLELATAVGSLNHIDASNVSSMAAFLRTVADDRDTGILANCETEHRLEAKVLRGATVVAVNGTRLEPVVKEWPFQFPTLWSHTHGARARYVDVLMRSNDIPWVVELKVNSGGKGMYYRHAIAQVVLYREFIRTATWIHPWFEDQGLDPQKCQAVVAFPTEGEDPRRLRALASLFEVKVTTLE